MALLGLGIPVDVINQDCTVLLQCYPTVPASCKTSLLKDILVVFLLQRFCFVGKCAIMSAVFT